MRVLSVKSKLIILFIVILIITIAVISFSTIFENVKSNVNSIKRPNVNIVYPVDGMTITDLVLIRGNASSNESSLVYVEIMINEGTWKKATGTYNWSYLWNTSSLSDDYYDIQARAWDGKSYSVIESVIVELKKPIELISNEHKWALFVAAGNYPNDNDSKLGNGGLYLAENISSYLVENCSYSTSNIIILFDDGWIRSDNGYGHRIQTLQQRPHKYKFNYGGATKKNLTESINQIISESNKYEDSEVFIWIFGHGYGSESRIAGGKIFQRSAVFLWDYILTDKDLGSLLSNLQSKKTAVLVDACYSGGFADKTIYNLPEFVLLNSNIPKSGRVVITGESKFRSGYAITTSGPVFTQIWFYGITTGDADGFKSTMLLNKIPAIVNMNKDGQVSVEEAYYYTSYILRSEMSLKEFSQMEPEINDQYPNRGLIRSKAGLIL
jgi:hypothetical protein